MRRSTIQAFDRSLRDATGPRGAALWSDAWRVLEVLGSRVSVSAIPSGVLEFVRISDGGLTVEIVAGPERPTLMERRDIVVTWPKTRPLAAYLLELKKAAAEGLVINYRVSRLPRWPEGVMRNWLRRPRCYMVYDGFVRGYCEIVDACYKPDGRVLDPHTGGFMRAGAFIVRDPEWHRVAPVPMKGFQGWRWWRGT